MKLYLKLVNSPITTWRTNDTMVKSIGQVDSAMTIINKNRSVVAEGSWMVCSVIRAYPCYDLIMCVCIYIREVQMSSEGHYNCDIKESTMNSHKNRNIQSNGRQHYIFSLVSLNSFRCLCLLNSLLNFEVWLRLTAFCWKMFLIYYYILYLYYFLYIHIGL